MITELFAAVSSIMGFDGNFLTLIHPINARAFQQINIVEIHRENMLPVRTYFARYSYEEVLKQSYAAASLYMWCYLVDEAFKMTNKIEF